MCKYNTQEECKYVWSFTSRGNESWVCEMKPLFELTYNQGYEDAKNEMYTPVERRTTCYTLNSTAEVIRKTVNVLYDLGLDGFSTDCEDDKCLVFGWQDVHQQTEIKLSDLIKGNYLSGQEIMHQGNQRC